jgi:hypothetical protein
MRGTTLLLTTGVLASIFLASCVKEPERKAVPPTSPNSKIGWSSNNPASGGGQFNALPQNQYRR